MKFGVREICDVVLKAKADQKIGSKIFYKNEPVIYFDTLKTSSMEGAATTVYAQGGRGNSRLMAWEGERTVTFTMEDALISPAGFMILTGAGLIEATTTKTIKVHTTEQTDNVTFNNDKSEVYVTLKNKPYVSKVDPTSKAISGDDYIYVMLLNNGEVDSEPFIPSKLEEVAGGWKLTLEDEWSDGSRAEGHADRGNNLSKFFTGSPIVLVDYYVERSSGVSEITITPDKFGGYYYLEASTLFRNTDGVDMPAEFIIPSCKIQSNFTFSMSSSGDPSTFTFTIDAFPDYTRFDRTKKVLAAIQVVTEAEDAKDFARVTTPSLDTEDNNGMIGGTRPWNKTWPTEAAAVTMEEY